MKLPWTNVDISYAIKHNQQDNKLECTIIADTDWPVFVTGRRKGKSYSNKRTFQCKPKEFEHILHGILDRANRRLKKLVKTQHKIEQLPEYMLSISTITYFVTKQEDE